MAVNQNLVEEIIDAIKPDKKTRNTIHSAVVARVDDQGTVWVYVAGSNRETPTASTSAEVKPGDAVTVEWRNDRLYIAGNYSDPSAGILRVANVEAAAQVASMAAAQAVEDASTAKTAAESAVKSAGEAATAAGDAQTSANNASEYAARALGNLSTVQSVTETLNWITAHGTMTLTTDTALDPTHVYFVQDNNGDYVVGGVHYAVVKEPKLADIGTYYELSIDESLNNYVATHLSVTSEGLWIIPDAGGNKVLIATGQGSTYTSAGTYIIGQADGEDVVYASFLSSGSTIGRQEDERLEITQDRLTAYNSDGVPFFEVDYDGGVITEEVTTKVHVDVEELMLRPGDRLRIGGVSVKNINGADITVAFGEFKFAFSNRGPASILETTNVDATVSERGVNLKQFNYVFTRGSSETVFASATVQFGYDMAGTATIGFEIIYNANNNYISFYTYGNDETTGLSPYYKIRNSEFNVIGEVTTTAPAFTFGINDGSIKGKYSARIGERLVAKYNNQTAIGKFNDNQQATAFEIGNGTSDTDRSNAFAVDWDGNIECALDTTAASGTTDGDLYAAITALGWEREVID